MPVKVRLFQHRLWLGQSDQSVATKRVDLYRVLDAHLDFEILRTLCAIVTGSWGWPQKITQHMVLRE